MDQSTEDFLTEILKELREGNAAAFVGAGLSKAAGYVDWPGLLADVARSIGLDATKETDLVGLAQFHLNANDNNRHRLNQILIDEFADIKTPTENHQILARLPISTFWTTNYDRLLETALFNSGKRADAKYTVKQLATTKRGRDAIVYKMHGDSEHPDQAVISKDDYERYRQTHGPFLTALSGDLVEKTFLFLGFSFTDPNLEMILSRVRLAFEKDQRQHYCIVKRRSKFAGESEEDFQYAVIKQALIRQDLRRYNIKTIFVDEYAEITVLLKTIEDRYRKKTVFISGSAHDYGSWGRAPTEEFVSKLARTLIDKDLRLTSGFGLGIGSAVVTGAIQQIYSTKDRSIDEQLVLRPFPIGISNAEERTGTFTRYRRELISQAGIAIFLMGNKEVEGKTVDADGVRAEFELARQYGLNLLPIGASGSVSKQLWKEVGDQFAASFPKNTDALQPLFDKLGEETDKPDTLMEPILKMIDILSKE